MLDLGTSLGDCAHCKCSRERAIRYIFYEEMALDMEAEGGLEKSQGA